MRELASVILAVLMSGGLLAGLDRAIYAARPDLGAQTRAMPPDSALPTQEHPVTNGPERTEDSPLPMPRPAVVVRVLTLDASDPWQPVPVALRRPAWNA